MSFSNQPSDLIRLAQTPYEQVQILCSSNEYYNQLCQQDEFWELRLKYEFDLDPYNVYSPQETYIQYLSALRTFDQIVRDMINSNQLTQTFNRETPSRDFEELTISIQSVNSPLIQMELTDKPYERHVPTPLTEYTGVVIYNLDQQKIQGDLVDQTDLERYNPMEFIGNFF